MPTQPVELGRFVFGIKIFHNPDGRIIPYTQSLNEGVLMDVVITQLRAFLQATEKRYFDDLDKHTPSSS